MEHKNDTQIFTDRFNRLGYIIIGVFIGFILALCIENEDFKFSLTPDLLVPGGYLYVNGLNPLTWSSLIPYFTSTAVAAAFTSFIIGIVRAVKKDNLFPRVVLRLQLLITVSILLGLAMGLIWAVDAWGSYWPLSYKDITLLCTVAIAVLLNKYFKRKTPSAAKLLLILSAQLILSIFIFWTSYPYTM